MSTDKPRHLSSRDYADAAEAYLRSLPLEHFMEATPHATQRKITLASLALVEAQRPEVKVFNELLVQYLHGRTKKIHQVVPDNMVVVHPEPIDAVGSFDVPFQPVGPFWMLEYVSKHSRRKDYEDNFRKYERELKVPYYLLFYPEAQEMTLFHHSGRKYAAVRPDAAGRRAIPELNLEVALLEEWVRFWFEGELLPLPAELQRDLREAQAQAREAQAQTREAQAQAREAQAQTREAQAQTREAQAQTREAQAQTERLRARMRQLGIDPDE